MKRDTTKRRFPRAGAASGRFVLRIGPGLHAALRGAAAAAGLSLNDYCARKLAAPAGDATGLAGATETVQRAAGLFGDRLLAVVAFGSWVRGEASDRSDLDALVVLDEGVPLTRALYRAWDRAPVSWGGRAVEPHFVHLPGPEERVAGLWAEVALDGVVLFEQALRLSTRLAGIRREIAAGRLVRRVVHGQPYWTEVA
jgi:predicted nucleotidyltransferase